MYFLAQSKKNSEKGGEHIPVHPDDLSGYLHRQVIGWLGLLFPMIVYIYAGLRNPDAATRWKPLYSISSYYYSPAVAPFVGILVSLGLFLLTYHGYDNDKRVYDRWATIIGGIAALGVAFFPTHPLPINGPEWWSDSFSSLHTISAAILFTVFALYALWFFRLTSSDAPPSANRSARSRIYLACGLAIIAGIIWSLINDREGRPLILPETLILMAFGISWLVKGRADRSIALLIRSMSD